MINIREVAMFVVGKGLSLPIQPYRGDDSCVCRYCSHYRLDFYRDCVRVRDFNILSGTRRPWRMDHLHKIHYSDPGFLRKLEIYFGPKSGVY